MPQEICRYRFAPGASMQDVEEALLLAAAAVEGLHGRSRLQLEATFRCCPATHTAEIDAGTEVGAALARIFTGLLRTTIGEPAFSVTRANKEAST